VLHPGTTSHSHRTQEERDVLGVQPGTLRLSIGIEDVADLLADLARVLEPAREAVA
jgi:O-acetylhomoserine (thiol)-lyase